MPRGLEYDIHISLKKYLISEDNTKEPIDFVNEFEVEVWFCDEEGMHIELAARAKVSRLMIGLSLDYEYPLPYVADATSSISDMANAILVMEEDADFMEKVDEMYDVPIVNSDICFLEYLEILPAHRGLKLGQRIVKSMAEYFYETCGIWVAQSMPLQFSIHDASDWDIAMEYKKFTVVKEEASKKLLNYFNTLGFRQFYQSDYLIATPQEILSKSEFS